MSADPVNSSDEAVEAAIARGMAAEPGIGWLSYREQVIVRVALAAAKPIVAAVRAEAVADERQRIAGVLVPQLLMEAEGGDDDPIDHACNSGVRLAISLIYAVCEVPLTDRVELFPAAGSVPVATPELTCDARGCREPVGECCLDPVATPPAEPATSPGIDLMKSGMDEMQDRLAAASQPVTCEHGKRRAHRRRISQGGILNCPGPVSVPKEGSE